MGQTCHWLPVLAFECSLKDLHEMQCCITPPIPSHIDCNIALNQRSNDYVNFLNLQRRSLMTNFEFYSCMAYIKDLNDLCTSLNSKQEGTLRKLHEFWMKTAFEVREKIFLCKVVDGKE